MIQNSVNKIMTDSGAQGPVSCFFLVLGAFCIYIDKGKMYFRGQNTYVLYFCSKKKSGHEEGSAVAQW